MAFPASVKLQDMQRTHADYDATTVQLHDALYRGGKAFKAVADSVLLKRDIEKMRAGTRADRVARSYYIPHASVLDVLVAQVFQDEPRFFSEPGTDYWGAESEKDVKAQPGTVNKNADGKGKGLAQVARELLLDAFLHGRAYLAIEFDAEALDPMKPETADARWSRVSAQHVDDWGPGWVRVHTKRMADASPFGERKLLDRWTFLSKSTVAVYEYDETARQQGTEPLVQKVSEVEHQFGRCPVYQMNVPEGMHIMDRLEPVLCALFNRESAHSFALDKGCFAVPVFRLNRDPSQLKPVILSEVEGIALEANEDFGFRAPPAQVYDAALKDLERLRSELARTVHNLILEQAAKTQSPREGAFAVAAKRGPLDALLASYSAPLRDLFEGAGQDVKTYRRDTCTVVLAGFGSFNADFDALARALGQGTPPGKAGDSVTPATDKPTQDGKEGGSDA